MDHVHPADYGSSRKALQFSSLLCFAFFGRITSEFPEFGRDILYAIGQDGQLGFIGVS
jgi:hypothetical protein